MAIFWCVGDVRLKDVARKMSFFIMLKLIQGDWIFLFALRTGIIFELMHLMFQLKHDFVLYWLFSLGFSVWLINFLLLWLGRFEDGFIGLKY